jgi:hypothetical protein
MHPGKNHMRVHAFMQYVDALSDIMLNVEGTVQRSKAVDHWLTVFPESRPAPRNERTIRVPVPGSLSDPGANSSPLDPGSKDSEWARKLRYVQEGQWESYSKVRSSS